MGGKFGTNSWEMLVSAGRSCILIPMTTKISPTYQMILMAVLATAIVMLAFILPALDQLPAETCPEGETQIYRSYPDIWRCKVVGK